MNNQVDKEDFNRSISTSPTNAAPAYQNNLKEQGKIENRGPFENDRRQKEVIRSIDDKMDRLFEKLSPYMDEGEAPQSHPGNPDKPGFPDDSAFACEQASTFQMLLDLERRMDEIIDRLHL